MKVEVPVEFDDVLVELIIEKILQMLQESQDRDHESNELPPYPNRKQIKRVLRIGDKRLNDWIAKGLKVIPFGKEMRFDREDVQEFLNTLKL